MSVPGRALRVQKTGNRQLDELQRSLLDTLAPLLASPFGSGKAIRRIVLVGGTPQSVPHGLGRTPVNVVFFNLIGLSPIQVLSKSASTVTLSSTSGVTLDIWVS